MGDEEKNGLVTVRIAAIQMKLLHLQYRKKKITQDQMRSLSNIGKHRTNKEEIKRTWEAAYNCIDMVICLDHLHQLMIDIFETPELKPYLEEAMRKLVGQIKGLCEKWVYVRNKLGGHLDIGPAEVMCRSHKYEGVFCDDDLDLDIKIINMMLIVGAVNEARRKDDQIVSARDILGRDLVMTPETIAPEMAVFAKKLTEDWVQAFEYAEHFMKMLYTIGAPAKKSKYRWETLISD